MLRKNPIAILAVALALAGCQTSETPQTPTAGIRPASGGWTSNETISSYELVGQRYQRRVGKSPFGSSYSIHPDGSGSIDAQVDEWSINCRKDKMTDRRECKLTSTSRGIIVTYSEGGSPEYICLIQHDFPGRSGAIRFDADPAIVTDKEGCIPGRHVARLRKSAHLTTRVVTWPYDYPKDADGPVAGFTEAEKLAEFIKLNVDKLTF